jgi:putative protease
MFPTIVAPGGSHLKALVASAYGADEVYLGVPFTSLRMRQNKLYTFEMLKSTIQQLHANGTKALLTMNIFPRNNDIQIFESVVEKIADLKPDGIIFSDPGTFATIRKYLPDTPLHLSTQTTTLNYAAVKFWAELGVKRIVLARELYIDEIAKIKKEVPEIELEAFVHGAMCMTYSGRCLLGDYL